MIHSLLLLHLVSQGPAQGSNVQDLAARTKPLVAHLEIQDERGETIGNGTGFCLGKGNAVATNFHVVEPAAAMRAKFSDGRLAPVLGVLAQDKKHDLAIVTLATPENGTPPCASGLGLDTGAAPQEGQRVVVVGSPRGLSWTISEGIVSAYRPEGLPKMLGAQVQGPIIQITAPIAPGSSGSPVVGEQGLVMGVAQSVIADTGNLNFAVPSNFLADLVDGIKPGAKPKPFQSAQTKRLIISAIVVVVFTGIYFFIQRYLRRFKQRK